MPLTSTLICTYNATDTINFTLDSVVNQIYKNQEILIRDDWSTDKTVGILKKRQQKDNRIKIRTSQKEWKKLWPYGWLNFLIDKAKWKYIAIQDHDDIWAPDKLMIQIDFMEKKLNYVWCGTWTLMYFSKTKVWYLVDTKEKDTNKVIHTSLLFRNQWYKYDTSIDFFSDAFFMSNILSWKKKKIKIIPEILTLHYYKETWDNLSEKRFKINFTNIKRYFNIYWYNIISLINITYITIRKFLPRRTKQRITYNISLRNKLLSKESLENGIYCGLIKYL